MRHLISCVHLLVVVAVMLAACGPMPVSQRGPLEVAPVTPTATPPPATPPPVNARVSGTMLLGDSPHPWQPRLRVRVTPALDVESTRNAVSVQPTFGFASEWKAGTLFLTPTERLQPGGTYTVTLAGPARLADGTPLGQRLTWSFTVPGLIQAQVGAMLSTETGNGRFRLTFNEPVQSAGLSEALTLTPTLPHHLVLLNQGRAADLVLDAPAGYDQTYTVAVRGPVTTQTGVRVTVDEAITFGTQPAVIELTPLDNLNPRRGTLTLRFASPVEAGSVAGAFRLEAAANPGQPIAGEFRSPDAQTMIFDPSQDLAAYATYTAVLDTGARDLDGRALLTAPRHWTVTTGSHQVQAGFGFGPNLQLIRSDGTRALPVVLQGADIRAVIEAYAFTPDQLRAAYDEAPHGTWGETLATPIALDGARPVASWPVDEQGGETASMYDNLVRLTRVPQDLAPGAYLLRLSTDLLEDQLLAVITPYALVAKRDATSLTVWVSTSAGPTPAMTVSAYDARGARVGTAATDAQGRAVVALAPDADLRLVFATDAQGVYTLSPLDDRWQSPGSAAVNWWEPVTGPRPYAAHVYTDRPIYQPGQTVHFKIVVRRDDDATLSTPDAGSPVTVRLRDARDNVVRTIYLQTDAYGSVASLFRLADGAMLGDYHLEAAFAGERWRLPFKVEQYRKPDIDVAVTTDAETYVHGDTVRLTVSARTFSGQPVAGATISLQEFDSAPAYYGMAMDWYPASERRDRIATTNGDGIATVEITASAPGGYPVAGAWASTLRVRQRMFDVTVQDGSGQAISAAASATVYNARSGVTVEADSWVQIPGQPFDVLVRTTDFRGQPVPDQTVTLYTRDYNSRDWSIRNESGQIVRTGADGTARVSVTVPAEGSYSFSAELGGESTDPYWIWAWKGAAAYTSPFNGEGLRLEAETRDYRIGETVAITATSPISGPAWLTIERGSVRRTEMVSLTAPFTNLNVTLEPGDSPNVFVTLAAWAPRDPADSLGGWTSVADAGLLTGSLELDVPADDQRLTVTLTADQDTYAPGETATFTAQVRDAAGNPVSAELSLALVDEAIFRLADDRSGSIFDAFYAPRALGVTTFDSYRASRYLALAYGMGGGGGGGEALPFTPRADFLDTAKWLPGVQTDADGQAQVVITLPDNLTAWRLTAKAVTTSAQMGEATLTVRTEQPLSLRPYWPALLTAGDRAWLSTVVRNDSGAAQTVAVALSRDAALALTGPATQTVALAAGEQRVIGFEVRAEQAGAATLTISAQAVDAPELRDGVRLTLPIRPLAVRDGATEAGDFRGTLTRTITVPSDVVSGTVRVDLSRTIAGGLLEGTQYLIGFPYGCVEQTMSRALPNAAVARAFRELGLDPKSVAPDLAVMVDASIQRLYGFQHDDGGWGWWYDDDSDAYQTAWVLYGLAVTREAGYQVDSGVLARGSQWLRGQLDGLDARTQAYSLFSLAYAGDGDLTATRRLIPIAATLDPFSQAALALTLHQLGAEQDARAVLDLLVASASAHNARVSWAVGIPDGHYTSKTMASTTRSTALALSAFLAIAPDHAYVPQIARYLMGERRDEGWGTTNETAFTLVALSDYLRQIDERAESAGYSVTVDGIEVAAGQISRNAPSATIELPAAELGPGTHTLNVTATGGERLYFALDQRLWRARAEIEAAGTLAVTRAYLHPTREVAAGPDLAVGDLVRVRLTVAAPSSVFYLLVEDPVPAGLEPLNAALNTTTHTGSVNPCEWSGNCWMSSWEAFGYNRKEVHADRVSFFVTEIKPGRWTVEYLTRVARPGTFTALPAEASAMYDPSLWGHTATDVVQTLAARR